MIWFIFGAAAGFVTGIFCMAMMRVASDSDDDAEKEYLARKRNPPDNQINHSDKNQQTDSSRGKKRQLSVFFYWTEKFFAASVGRQEMIECRKK